VARPGCATPRQRKATLLALGALVRQRRKALGLQQQDLADQAELHPMTISDIERGRSAPQRTTLERLGRALGLDLSAYAPGPSHQGTGAAQAARQWREAEAVALRSAGAPVRIEGRMLQVYLGPTLRETLAEVRQAVILAALEARGGDRSRTAVDLGVSRNTVLAALRRAHRRAAKEVPPREDLRPAPWEEPPPAAEVEHA